MKFTSAEKLLIAAIRWNVYASKKDTHNLTRAHSDREQYDAVNELNAHHLNTHDVTVYIETTQIQS